MENRQTCINGAVEYLCDINDQMRLTEILAKVKPDVIIHLAGISFAVHDNTREIYQANLLGTLSLLKAIEDSKCCPYKVILASSAHVYGNQAQSPILESCIPAPVSDYAVSKLAMEHMARLWFDRLPILVTRPFNYTGVGQTAMFLPPKIVNHFVRRAPEIELGNLDVARDWSDVRDVTLIYRRLLECPAHGVVVNICSGISYSLQYVLETMIKITGHQIKVRVNPEFVRLNEVKELRGENSLLQSLIGNIPRRPLQETLAWMYESELSLTGAIAGEAKQ
ncbi:GDP-6-deoxy-D-talose 4-dehydrogenase [Sporotomaculum syntrophicum]|uniref:GDP-6-deoxy-D-talose 4-dehydrogenase n=1 Tax=Sporotomaculum syntrophicum TaxID=182264 RepID=A0A9D3AZM2_9FIRM|nr:GDP-6-deoxy-D-talose 4-dehydrogenase [Sporotomaculum syntrophicum]